MKEKTTQVRANLKIDIALLLELEAEKQKKPVGVVIQEVFKDSPYWQRIEEKFNNFKKDY